MSIQGGHADCRSCGHASRIVSISINARPSWALERASVTGKAIPYGGRDNSGVIVTHAERKSGYLIAVKLLSRHAQPLPDTTIHTFKRLPVKRRQTMPYDNGSEFADFHRILQATGLASTSLARPHAPWQRGCNENLNGLFAPVLSKKHVATRRTSIRPR